MPERRALTIVPANLPADVVGCRSAHPGPVTTVRPSNTKNPLQDVWILQKREYEWGNKSDTVASRRRARPGGGANAVEGHMSEAQRDASLQLLLIRTESLLSRPLPAFTPRGFVVEYAFKHAFNEPLPVHCTKSADMDWANVLHPNCHGWKNPPAMESGALTTILSLKAA